MTVCNYLQSLAIKLHKLELAKTWSARD